jgi:hypothetical protein
MARRRSTPEPRAASRPGGAGPRLSKHRLQELVRAATLDAYGEEEEITGLFISLEDSLDLPFETEVLGVPVTVEKVDLDEGDRVVALCRRGRDRQAIDLLHLPLPTPRPGGWEWIEAYRHWVRLTR